MSVKERYQLTRRATFVGVIVNSLLGISKIAFGILGSSAALFADGVHSLADLLTDFFVLLAAKYGAEAADAEHPYGHGRIETVAALALTLFLAGVGLGILADAVQHLMHPSLRVVKPIVLVVALISVLANEILFRYTMHLAKKARSELLRANAWHARSDALSSVVVLIGLIGVYLGVPVLDPVAAIIVGVMILHMGWVLAWPSLRELVDTGVTEDKLTKIEQLLQEVPGVVALHQLRTRTMAGDIFVDVHVLVEPRLTVSEGHYIGEHARAVLIQALDEVKDVTVHVDPEDDEQSAPSKHLPTRREVLAELDTIWATLPGFKELEMLRLHYLDGKLQLELYLPLTILSDWAEAKGLKAQYQTRIEQSILNEQVSELTIRFSL